MTPSETTIDLAYLALAVLGDFFILSAAGLVALAVGDMFVSIVQLVRR